MSNDEIAVIGLGYVGLPLAFSLSKKFRVIGFDISSEKISLYKKGVDVTNEIGDEVLKSTQMAFTDNEPDIKEKEFYIVAVPTPIQENNLPNLKALQTSSEIVGRNMKKGSIVVYESTVFPGVTEEYCGPIIEKNSGIRCGEDFNLGYSPERINPGDKVHTFEKILKIVSAQDEESLERICEVYSSVIEAGIFKASSRTARKLPNTVF